MKKILILIVLVLGTYSFVSSNNKTLIIKNDNLYKNIKHITLEEKKVSLPEEDVDVLKEEPLVIEVKKEIKEIKLEPKIIEPKKEVKPVVIEEPIFKTEDKVLETLVGKMTGYGPDCGGCTSGKTASGHDIINDGIYFNDATYGNVRIVSGDSNYKFGTIVRITNYGFGTDPIIAVVLDKGGGVGKADNKHCLFDLLFKTESDANSTVGTKHNVKFEILRLGW